MSPYLTFAILLALAILQSTVMPRIALLGVHPDLMLMAVTSWSLLRGSREGMLWALIGGSALDLFSGARYGVSALPLLVVSFLSGLGHRNVFRFDLLIPIMVIPLTSLAYNGLMLTLLGFQGWPIAWRDAVLKSILPSTLINTLGMPIVYLSARAIDRRTRGEEIAW
jgi:rod shape-determining protein MreD